MQRATMSCLTQARGLKCPARHGLGQPAVVPHAGTWIEIVNIRSDASVARRASRRHVD